MTNVQVTNSPYGQFMVFPNDAIGETLIAQREFEPHFTQVINAVVKSGDTVIDCGANLGLHTVSLAKLVGPAGQVIAVEPLRIIYQQLCGNIFLNNLHNVIAANVALGDRNAQVQMEPLYLDGAHINIGGTKVGSGGELVEMTTIDSMNVGKISFMKLDVQGNEVNLLNGAAATIQHSRPIMFVEVEDNWLRCFGASSEILLNQLLSMNYVLIRIKTSYPCDHVAIPRESMNLVGHVVNSLKFPCDIIDGRSVKLNFAGSSRPDINYHTFTIN